MATPPAGGQSLLDTQPATTVRTLRRGFLDHSEKVLGSSLATVSRYTGATDHLEKFTGGDAPAAGISATAFVEHLRGLEISPNGHKSTTRRKLRDRGLRYILEVCRAMYRYGSGHGLLSKEMPNPFTSLGLRRFKTRDSRPIFVFSEEQEYALYAAAGFWSFAIHFTLAKTGLRPGELAHLLIEDLDLRGGWLHVSGKSELGWTIKTGRERQVPIVAELALLLRAVLGERKVGPVFLREHLWKRKTPKLVGDRAAMSQTSSDRIRQAAAENGKALTRQAEARIRRGVWRDAGATNESRVRSSFIRATKAAGLLATCPKSWRHTFATLLQEANVDLLVRQITMGHTPASPERSALGMTSVYTHTNPEFQRREIERALRLRPRTLEIVHRFIKE